MRMTPKEILEKLTPCRTEVSCPSTSRLRTSTWRMPVRSSMCVSVSHGRSEVAEAAAEAVVPKREAEAIGGCGADVAVVVSSLDDAGALMIALPTRDEPPDGSRVLLEKLTRLRELLAQAGTRLQLRCCQM